MCGDIEVDGIPIQILVPQHHGVDMNGFSN
jgi:hypothetical protein